LASVNPGNDLFEMLGKDQAGFCLTNGDDDGLRIAALTLATDPELRESMGTNSRKLLERLFTAEGAARQIMKHFQQPESLVEPSEAVHTRNPSLRPAVF
jgi:glycosyltransferase involved in cell wall biosynthesis